MSQSHPEPSGPSDLGLKRICNRISRIEMMPLLLRGVARLSGMRFGAVAHVTDEHWICCAVYDELGFGLRVGDELDVNTTLCREVREERSPIVILDVAQDPEYCDHPTPRQYQFRSYLSFPIILNDGTYYGNLCALDTQPSTANVESLKISLGLLADLIAARLSGDIERDVSKAVAERLHGDTLRLRALDQQKLADVEASLELSAGLMESERADWGQQQEEFRLAEDVHVKRMDEAQKQTEMREEFIAELGHDLRNPLAAIVAYTELLRRRESDPVQVNIANRIALSAKRMADMIGNVMDMTRIRVSGGLRVDLRPTQDLANAFRNTAREIQDAQPLRVFSIVVGPIPPVHADVVRLQQLVSNLLGNAVTHGDESQPIAMRAAWESGALEIVVQNGGKPIPESALETIFEPFKQGRSRAGLGGVGLGLHICAQVAKAHDGSVAVESDRRRTLFRVLLHLRPA